MSAFESLAVITGQWISLRPVGREDYPTLFRWRSTFDVNMLNFSRRVATYEEFVGEIERVLPSSIFWLVRDNQLRVPIGFTLGYQLNPWDGWMLWVHISRRSFVIAVMEERHLS